MRVIVKRQSPRTWGIYDVKGNLVEGGFFSKHVADEAAAEWRDGSR